MSGWEELIGVVVSLDLSYSLKEYVQALAKIPQEKLDDLQTRIVIIGCGEWQLPKPIEEIRRPAAMIHFWPLVS